jgi:hypothetical protein
MAVPDGRICAINLLPLKSGATIEQFERFSSERAQPLVQVMLQSRAAGR